MGIFKQVLDAKGKFIIKVNGVGYYNKDSHPILSCEDAAYVCSPFTAYSNCINLIDQGYYVELIESLK